MTLRDLFSAYAADVFLRIVMYDNNNSVYCLRFKFEDAAGHDFEIFEKYSDARVIEWYQGIDMVNVLLDIEKF